MKFTIGGYMMKKEYEKPIVEIISLISDEVMSSDEGNIGGDGPSVGGGDIEDW